ncbi:MAG: hypothetical protein HC884_15050 [Chloroflexaceae bacterium]|nr:hypothetical protein [Chloroflexaceae bacterium]
MQTDIPLKRLTMLRAADLLPLLGVPHATLLAVETLELPASNARLDNILHVRSPSGLEYLHLIEWQGYPDQGVLWRVLGYLAWIGRHNPTKTVVGTLVYLTPPCDMGDTLTQAVDGEVFHSCRIPCVRLWQQDATAALATNRPGMAVLSPLMRGATRELVEQAARLVMEQTALPQQSDLLSVLGVFAEPMMTYERFVRFVGKE